MHCFRYHFDPVRHGAQNGGAGGLDSAICAGRRGAGDVRHGTGDRDSNLSRCNYTTNRYNLYIVAISLGVGMTPTLSHDFFSKLPAVLQPLLHSGIMLATLSAVVLNVFFNGYQHHADLVKESVSDKDLKVRTVRMWLLMRKLKKNEHGE